jgi:hypothetical protein
MRGYLQSDILTDEEGWHYVKVRDRSGREDVVYLDHPDGEHRSKDCECVWRHLGIWAWHYNPEECPDIHIDQEVMHLLQDRVKTMYPVPNQIGWGNRGNH